LVLPRSTGPSDRIKPLKRKKNALALALQIVGRTKIDWTDMDD
jgi:hypothetical protein